MSGLMRPRHVVVRDIRRTTADLLYALAASGVAATHEAQGRAGLLATDIRPIQTDAVVAGSAVTVLSHPGDNLMVHAAVEVCRPGDVLVVALTAPSTDGMIGDLLATSLRAHGVVGIVTEAGIRDTTTLRAMDFPVWARAVSAQGTVKATPGSVNVPVVCAGQLIEPGDAVVADADGVVRVPRLAVAEVVDAVRERLASEERKRAQLAAGTLGVDMYGLRPLLADLGVVYVDVDADR